MTIQTNMGLNDHTLVESREVKLLLWAPQRHLETFLADIDDNVTVGEESFRRTMLDSSQLSSAWLNQPTLQKHHPNCAQIQVSEHDPSISKETGRRGQTMYASIPD